VKGWYTYCMGLVTYDLSAWDNGGSGAWRRGHSATARVPASLLVSLPVWRPSPMVHIFLQGHQRQGGYNEGAVG
jgi:hypothetical protein